jgi:hypothetical protein
MTFLNIFASIFKVARPIVACEDRIVVASFAV